MGNFSVLEIYAQSTSVLLGTKFSALVKLFFTFLIFHVLLVTLTFD